jgi:hypothetical protein
MQPGYPPPEQDPQQPGPPGYPAGYGQMPSYQDPFSIPPQGSEPPVSVPPPAADPYAPQSPAYGPPQPSFGAPQPPPFGAPQPPGYPAQPYEQYPQQPVSASPYGYQYPAGSGYTVPTGVSGYGGVPGSNRSNTLGLLAMIFGIVSIPMLCCYIGLPLGAAAVVLGILGMRKAAAGEASNRGMALAGLICGAIGLVLSLLTIVGNIVLPFTTLSQ